MNQSSQNTTIPQPPDWGKDELSSFLVMAEKNTYATFHNAKPHCKKLKEINDIFNESIDCMKNSLCWFEFLFFIKAHGAFLGATRLGVATQVADAMPMIRSIIEFSLYGFFIHNNSEYGKIWLRRHDGDDEKKKVKETFKIGSMFDELKKADQTLETIARKSYEQSIDHGAHPNERGLSMVLKRKETEKTITFNVTHLTEGWS